MFDLRVFELYRLNLSAFGVLAFFLYCYAYSCSILLMLQLQLRFLV